MKLGVLAALTSGSGCATPFPRMTREETSSYLRHLVRLAGRTDTSPLRAGLDPSEIHPSPPYLTLPSMVIPTGVAAVGGPRDRVAGHR